MCAEGDSGAVPGQNVRMQETSPSVVVIGDALIDEIRDGTGVRELVGGAALNVAVGLRRLGVPTTLIAMVAARASIRGERVRIM